MVNQINWKEIKGECDSYGAQLVAVTKTHAVEELEELYDLGERSFGENRVQELLDKKDLLPEDIEWHLIGHLQRNKVKYIAPFIQLIHSVDSMRLLKEMNKQGKKNERVLDCLLQFHIAQEESKYGIKPNQVTAFMEELSTKDYKWIRVRGLMGMASFTEDSHQVKEEFDQLISIYKQLKDSYFRNEKYFDTLSMGMSGDYQIALEKGSTMIRVGSKLFT